MKDMKKIAELIVEMEHDMATVYHTHEILQLLKEDPSFVQATLTAVMGDREHFTSIGMIIGEA